MSKPLPWVTFALMAMMLILLVAYMWVGSLQVPLQPARVAVRRWRSESTLAPVILPQRAHNGAGDPANSKSKSDSQTRTQQQLDLVASLECPSTQHRSPWHYGNLTVCTNIKPEWGKAFPRIHDAMMRFKPDWVHVVNTPEEADVHIVHMLGAGEMKDIVHPNTVLIQHLTDVTSNLNKTQFLDIWSAALLTMSFHDLDRLVGLHAPERHHQIRTWSSPWGVDPQQFPLPANGQVQKASTRYAFITGEIAASESHREVLWATEQVGLDLKHTGWGDSMQAYCNTCRLAAIAANHTPCCTRYQHLAFQTNEAFHQLLKQATWVPVLRRDEGFEMMGMEALFSGSRPIVFDLDLVTQPYRWFKGHAALVHQVPGPEPADAFVASSPLVQELVGVMQQPPAPLSLEEMEVLTQRFDWRSIIPAFYTAIRVEYQRRQQHAPQPSPPLLGAALLHPGSWQDNARKLFSSCIAATNATLDWQGSSHPQQCPPFMVALAAQDRNLGTCQDAALAAVTYKGHITSPEAISTWLSHPNATPSCTHRTLLLLAPHTYPGSINPSPHMQIWLLDPPSPGPNATAVYDPATLHLHRNPRPHPRNTHSTTPHPHPHHHTTNHATNTAASRLRTLRNFRLRNRSVGAGLGHHHSNNPIEINPMSPNLHQPLPHPTTQLASNSTTPPSPLQPHRKLQTKPPASLANPPHQTAPTPAPISHAQAHATTRYASIDPRPPASTSTPNYARFALIADIGAEALVTALILHWARNPTYTPLTVASPIPHLASLLSSHHNHTHPSMPYNVTNIHILPHTTALHPTTLTSLLSTGVHIHATPPPSPTSTAPPPNTPLSHIANLARSTGALLVLPTYLPALQHFSPPPPAPCSDPSFAVTYGAPAGSVQEAAQQLVKAAEKVQAMPVWQRMLVGQEGQRGYQQDMVAWQGAMDALRLRVDMFAADGCIKCRGNLWNQGPGSLRRLLGFAKNS